MKRIYILGMAAALGLCVPMASCSDDEAVTKDEMAQIIKDNALTADQVKAMVAANTLTQEEIEKLIEDNMFTQEEIEEIVKEYDKVTIDKEYHTVGIDTLEQYVYNFKGGNTAYIKVEGATDGNIGDVFEAFYKSGVKGVLDLSDCDLEDVTATITALSFFGNATNYYQIASIVFPKSLRSLPEDFSNYNYNLKEVTFLGGIEELPAGVFGQGALSKVTLSESLKAIDKNAFYSCSLKTVEIPSNVTTIEEGAFKNNSLDTVTFLGKYTEGMSIESTAFDGNASGMKIIVKDKALGEYLKTKVNKKWNVYCGGKEVTSDDEE